MSDLTGENILKYYQSDNNNVGYNWLNEYGYLLSGRLYIRDTQHCHKNFFYPIVKMNDSIPDDKLLTTCEDIYNDILIKDFGGDYHIFLDDIKIN